MARHLEFDIEEFSLDIQRACNAAGVSRRTMALLTGVSENTIYRMTSANAAPPAASLAALCKWAKLDVGKYSIERGAR